ncbi:universal stress protein [Muriicola sp. Z0-33]|uniref:universal stress protein n=1 Tax=Muriicola sp. Z0-33 TaxID=2816957 RepID=UPI002237072F|nr:universal stress protein [Muriicola sp. Z0-33]MCW5515571.1 universal stress protein [Muriicola sp. Z0-33]
MDTQLKVIAGISGTDVDQKLIAYLNFLAEKIPISEITHLHVIKMLYNFGDINKIVKEDLQYMADRFKEERLGPILRSYDKVAGLSASVLFGKVVPRFEETLAAKKASTIALGKKAKGSSNLAKNIIRKLDCNTLIVPSNSEHRFKNILVTVDLSEHSGKLLEKAIDIQKSAPNRVSITCLHAFEVIDIPAYTLLHTKERVRRDTRATVQEAFDKFIDKYQTNDSRIETVLIEETNNWPSQYILNYINDENNAVDFVIMGTQGHTRIAALLGSTVEKVISRNNKCPMLIIK